MAVLETKEAFMKALEVVTGENASDETLAALGDISETYDALASGATEGITKEQHEKELADLDAAWRAKYKEAYFHGAPEEKEAEENKDEEKEEPETYEDLFEEVK